MAIQRARRPAAARVGRVGSYVAVTTSGWRSFTRVLLVSSGEEQHAQRAGGLGQGRSEEHTSELQSRLHLVCRLLLEKKKKTGETQSFRVTNLEIDLAW